MATLAVYETSRGGDSKAYVAADVAGDSCPNDGRTILHFKNTNASPRTVTVNSIRPCDQGFDHNEQVPLAAGSGDEMAGPYPVDRFGSTLTWTYDAVTNVTVACIRIPAT